MKKRLFFVVVLLVCLQLFFVATAFANIQYIGVETSAEKIIRQEGRKLMLTKEWYHYRFEVNPIRENGYLKLRSVNIEEYQRAIDEVEFSLDFIKNYNIYFLDYRLVDYPTARALSFLDNSVVVFGVYYDLSKENVHRLAVHELGHEIDFALMDNSKWSEYRRLRGIEDRQKYSNASQVYVNRLQEIFAEDFRLLFGGEKARVIVHLNQELPDPREVEGLREFFLRLAN